MMYLLDSSKQKDAIKLCSTLDGNISGVNLAVRKTVSVEKYYLERTDLHQISRFNSSRNYTKSSICNYMTFSPWQRSFRFVQTNGFNSGILLILSSLRTENELFSCIILRFAEKWVREKLPQKITKLIIMSERRRNQT